MSGIPLQSAPDSGRPLRTALGVAALEVALGLGLGVAVHPFLFLLVPPVAAVVGIGTVAPDIRTRVLGGRRRHAAGTPDSVLSRLLVVAVAIGAFAGLLDFSGQLSFTGRRSDSPARDAAARDCPFDRPVDSP